MIDVSQILTAISVGEDSDWEFKSAKGGLPRSLWETYSAMANTDGGTIVLGVKEKDGQFTVQGLDDAQKQMQDFWNQSNDRGKVSLNLLENQDVAIREVGGKQVLVIAVPRASRQQRPVFVGMNPLHGTFRRYNEGDYKCNQDEVGRMLADQSEQPADSAILENFSIDDLDETSLGQYRNRFRSRAPGHPWLAEDDRGLLEKLGGWRRDRSKKAEGLTAAGLLMFGKDEAIRDPSALPQFHLDFREKFSDDPAIRWTDRLTIDGTWVGNLFQFYQKVIQRLTVDLKIPFQMQPNLFRKDDTIVHEAIREALVNALIHADYRGQGGVVVEKYRDRIELSNPGSLLVSIEQMLRGGVSECRNKALQQMFQQIGGGEKAGSGIDKIRQGWASQKWRWPNVQTQLRPDRVRLVLPMVSLLPDESLARLQARLGKDFDSLSPDEVQALVTADVEGEVSNQRLQDFSRRHRTDITKTLQSLVFQGLLAKFGHGPWATYRLDGHATAIDGSGEGAPISSPHSELNSPHSGGSSPHNEKSSPHNELNSPHNEKSSPHSGLNSPHSDPELIKVATSVRDSPRVYREHMEAVILDLCRGRYLTPPEIAALVKRNPHKLRDRFLTPLSESGRLLRKHPKPNDPNQAYTTAPTTEIQP